MYHTNESDKEFLRNSRANVSTVLPAIIVAVWSSSCVNLQVMADGPLPFWKTSIMQGPVEGQWSWPEIFSNQIK